MYERILLMDDGSAIARRAIPHAGYMASLAQGSVLVLRVSHAAGLEPDQLSEASWADCFVERDGEDSAARPEADPPLSEVTAALKAAGVATVGTLVLHHSDEGEAIVAAARNLRCDLIVMSTHGLSGLRRAVLGSVADYVVRHADGIPVLLSR